MTTLDSLSYDPADEVTSSLQTTIGNDIWIKSVDVIVNFQQKTPARFWWGESVQDRTLHPSQKNWTAFPKEATNTEILDRLRFKLSKLPLTSQEMKELMTFIEDLRSFLTSFNFEKYPGLSAKLIAASKDGVLYFCREVSIPGDLQDRNIIPKEQFLEWIRRLSHATLDLRLSIENSPGSDSFKKMQNLLSLYSQFFEELLSSVEEKTARQERLCTLPETDAEVQTYLAKKREKLEASIQSTERKKVSDCYKNAIQKAQESSGFMNLSNISMAVIFSKRSKPEEPFTVHYEAIGSDKGSWRFAEGDWGLIPPT